MRTESGPEQRVLLVPEAGCHCDKRGEEGQAKQFANQ